MKASTERRSHFTGRGPKPRPKDRVKGQPAWWLSLLWVCDARHHRGQGNLSLQSIHKLAEWAEWPVQQRSDMWSQHRRQRAHTHFLIHCLSSPKNRPKNCKRPLETQPEPCVPPIQEENKQGNSRIPWAGAEAYCPVPEGGCSEGREGRCHL